MQDELPSRLTRVGRSPLVCSLHDSVSPLSQKRRASINTPFRSPGKRRGFRRGKRATLAASKGALQSPGRNSNRARPGGQRRACWYLGSNG